MSFFLFLFFMTLTGFWSLTGAQGPGQCLFPSAVPPSNPSSISFPPLSQLPDVKRSAFQSDNTRFMNPSQGAFSPPFYMVTWNPSASLLFLLTPQGFTHGQTLGSVLFVNPADSSSCANLQLNSNAHQWSRFIDWPSPGHYLQLLEEPIFPFPTNGKVYSQFLTTNATTTLNADAHVLHLTLDTWVNTGDLPLFWQAPPFRSHMPVWWSANQTSAVPSTPRLKGVQSLQFFQTPSSLNGSTPLYLTANSIGGQISMSPYTASTTFWTLLFSTSNLCVYLACYQQGKTWDDSVNTCT